MRAGLGGAVAFVLAFYFLKAELNDAGIFAGIAFSSSVIATVLCPFLSRAEASVSEPNTE